MAELTDALTLKYGNHLYDSESTEFIKRSKIILSYFRIYR